MGYVFSFEHQLENSVQLTSFVWSLKCLARLFNDTGLLSVFIEYAELGTVINPYTVELECYQNYVTPILHTNAVCKGLSVATIKVWYISLKFQQYHAITSMLILLRRFRNVQRLVSQKLWR